MQEKLQKLLVNSDSDVVEMLASILADSDLSDKYDLIEANIADLTILKSNCLSNYSNKYKKIYLDEDMFDKIVLAHEFGHFMYEFFPYNDFEDLINHNISKAQKKFTEQYINGDLIDFYERRAKQKMEQYITLEINNFKTLLNDAVVNEDYNVIFELLKKTIRNDYQVNIDDSEELEQKLLMILNNNSLEVVVKYILDNYGIILANKKAMIRLNNEEPKGVSMLIDLLSAIHEGKYYEFSFCHKPDYYKKSNDRSFEEEFANYVALRLTNCKKALQDIGNILGYDYLLMMDRFYNVVLENMARKKNQELK